MSLTTLPAFQLLNLLLDLMLCFERRGLPRQVEVQAFPLKGAADRGLGVALRFSTVAWSSELPVSSNPEKNRYSSRWYESITS